MRSSRRSEWEPHLSKPNLYLLKSQGSPVNFRKTCSLHAWLVRSLKLLKAGQVARTNSQSSSPSLKIISSPRKNREAKTLSLDKISSSKNLNRFLNQLLSSKSNQSLLRNLLNKSQPTTSEGRNLKDQQKPPVQSAERPHQKLTLKRFKSSKGK